MSDWIILASEAPEFVPDKAARDRAVSILREALPAGAEVQPIVEEGIEVFDAGVNMGWIRCPGCGAELAREDDQKWFMRAVVRCNGARRAEDLTVRAPCCGARVPLNGLEMEWPWGFARFALEAMNPDVEEIPADVRAELERVLGCRLRQVWQNM